MGDRKEVLQANEKVLSPEENADRAGSMRHLQGLNDAGKIFAALVI
jgi:hypothetical protein